MASEYLLETSFAHITRKATEATAEGIAERITEHGPAAKAQAPEGSEGAPKGDSPRCPHGQVLASLGAHGNRELLVRQDQRAPVEQERQSRHQPPVKCEAWNLRAPICGKPSGGAACRPAFQRRTGRESGAVLRDNPPPTARGSVEAEGETEKWRRRRRRRRDRAPLGGVLFSFVFPLSVASFFCFSLGDG